MSLGIDRTLNPVAGVTLPNEYPPMRFIDDKTEEPSSLSLLLVSDAVGAIEPIASPIISDWPEGVTARLVVRLTINGAAADPPPLPPPTFCLDGVRDEALPRAPMAARRPPKPAPPRSEEEEGGGVVLIRVLLMLLLLILRSEGSGYPLALPKWPFIAVLLSRLDGDEDEDEEVKA